MSIAKNSPSASVVETAGAGGPGAQISLGESARQLFQANLRDYGMYFAFFVIIAFFTIATNGLFISSRNISNLINQTGYIAALAVGMTLVIVIRHIDLSVGFLAGFLGAVGAIALTFWHWPVWVVIPFVLALGVVAGLGTGFLVATMGIPAFVATLAGWLGYRGALQVATAGSGTIVVADDIFNAIGNGYIPDIPGLAILPGLHKLTLLLGLAGILLYVVSAVNDRRKTQAYHFAVLPASLFAVQVAAVSVLIAAITVIMAGYQGLSWTAVIILIIVIIYHFITTQTVLGRHIFAVGGNPEAAQLSGVSVKRITYLVFASMGLMTALCGILFTSRFRSAQTTAGTLFELDAIAAAFVGGAAVAGGVGTVVGSILGAMVMASLTNGMNLMGIDISYQYIVRALVLAAAVMFDVATRKRAT